MTDIQQLASDLRFVRGAVEARGRQRRSHVSAFIWAGYSLVGFTLINVDPRASSLFFLVGGVAGCIVTAVIEKRADRRAGQIDRVEGRRQMLHWFGGFVLIVGACIALQLTNPVLRSPLGGQISVVMVGLMYFLAGANGPPNAASLLWGGPLVMAGAIAVSFIPHWGWTGLGVLIAAIILLPAVRRPDRAAPVQP